VAYLNHDIADAIRAGILRIEDLPQEVNDTLGASHSQRIDALVTDVVDASWDASGEGAPFTEEPPTITMNPPVRRAANLLREFMFQEVYLPLGKTEEAEVAKEIIRVLFQRFVKHPDQIPPAYFRHEENENQAAVDYLSGMTDHYAIRQAEALQPGISRGVFARVPLV
jgi:dGTPase